MKTKYYLAAAFICIGLQNKAQTTTQPNKDSFDNLKLNSSPAFVVLGIEPDNIQRPGTPTKLIAGLQNAIVDGKLQPNIAFEISPYFLKNQKDPNDKHFDPVTLMLDKKNFITTLYRSLSISLATSQTDQQVFGNLKPGTGIGLGIHALLVDGQPTRLLKTWWNDYSKTLFVDKLKATVHFAPAAQIDNFDAVFESVWQTYQTQTLASLSLKTLSGNDLKKFHDEIKTKMLGELQTKTNRTDKATIDSYLDDIKTEYDGDLSKSLAAVNTGKNPLAKQGFILDLAFGDSFVFQDNVYNDVANAKAAFWLTPSYRWDVSADGKEISLLDAMGVARYTINNQQAGIDVANYLDLGAKVAFTQEKWSGSFEGVYRYASNTPADQQKNHTYRATIGINYKISDIITFTFNFGTNFDGNTTTYTDPKKMFAVGGLNFGLPFIQTGK